MNVSQNSPIDLPNWLAWAHWPHQWTGLRQRRELSTDTAQMATAGEPEAATIDSAATLPSWPRIFPGL